SELKIRGLIRQEAAERSEIELAVRQSERLDIRAHAFERESEAERMTPAREEQVVVKLKSGEVIKIGAGAAETPGECSQTGDDNRCSRPAWSCSQRRVGRSRNQRADAFVIACDGPAESESQGVHRYLA